jgi:uncharacterized membrane protein YjjP (DUF1212 family)
MSDPGAVLALLRALGEGMLESGQATNVVDARLRATAAAYGIPDLRTIVLPTSIVLQSGSTVELAQPNQQAARLDQAGAIDRLSDEALSGTVDATALATRIAEVRASAPRRGPVAIVAGTLLLTVGFGLLLNPTAAALPAYAVLGTFVGILVVLAQRRPSLATLMPVVAAFLVTLVATQFLAEFVGDDALRVIAPALVTFFPGLTLTIAAMELTSNQVVSGGSRLVYGIAQLLLIAFGVFAATLVTGSAATGGTSDTLGWWAAPVGVLIVGVGYVLQQSAPTRALPWVLAASIVAYGAQFLVATFVSPEVSGFAAAAVVIPFAQLASRIPSAPPARVMTLAVFWLLVPGALGFIGVGEAGADDGSGVQTIVTAAVSVLAIALGILVGGGLTRDAAALTRRIVRAPSRRHSD